MTLLSLSKGALRWAYRAAARTVVATMRGAHEAAFAELLAATSTTGVTPSAGTDGVNIDGLGTIDIVCTFDNPTETAEFRFWLYTGSNWAAAESTKTITAPTGVTVVFIEPLDVETFQRVFAELVAAPSAGNVALDCSPQNAE